MILVSLALKVLPRSIRTRYIDRQMQNIDAGILALVDRRKRLMQLIIALHPECNYQKNVQQEEKILLKKNKKTTVPDDKLLEIWGKIVELSGNVNESKKDDIQ